MKRNCGFSTIRTLAAAVLMAVIPVIGCSGAVERRWSEEVELDSGEIIVVNRYVRFVESRAITGSAYSSTLLESRLEFMDDLDSLPEWAGELVPLVLYQDAASREWVVVASNFSCVEWEEHGKPNPPYWEFRLMGGQWLQSKLSEASIGRKSNLFFSYESKQPAKRLTRKAKAEVLEAHPFDKRYLTVLADQRSKCG